LERAEDIRSTLAQEIARKEVELGQLRHTLRALDSALAAAAEAHARSAAAHALSKASQIAAEARRYEKPTASPMEVKPAKPLPAPVSPHLAGEKVQPRRPSSTGKYVNLKVWKAVQTLLFERAEKMSIEEIARELKAGGASLGDSPVRTVATAVGYMNTKIFHVTKSGGKTLVDLIARN